MEFGSLHRAAVGELMIRRLESESKDPFQSRSLEWRPVESAELLNDDDDEPANLWLDTRANASWHSDLIEIWIEIWIRIRIHIPIGFHSDGRNLELRSIAARSPSRVLAWNGAERRMESTSVLEATENRGRASEERDHSRPRPHMEPHA